MSNFIYAMKFAGTSTFLKEIPSQFRTSDFKIYVYGKTGENAITPYKLMWLEFAYDWQYMESFCALNNFCPIMCVIELVEV